MDTTAWAKKEWVYGAYSAAAPGKSHYREVLAAPIDGDTLYFAGEACYNSEYNGSYAAAYNSALRAPNAVVGRKRGPASACQWRPIEQDTPEVAKKKAAERAAAEKAAAEKAKTSK